MTSKQVLTNAAGVPLPSNDTLPVNAPHATTANTPYRDGLMRYDGNHGSRNNFSPTQHEYPQVDKSAAAPGHPVEGMADRTELNEDDHADQALMFYQMLSGDEKDRLIHTIGGSLGMSNDDIQKRQISLFRQVDKNLADRVSTAVSEVQKPQPDPKPGA